MMLGMNPLMGTIHNPGTLKTNLVSLWDFNDSSGSLIDQHNSNDLIVGVAPTYSQPGQIGDSISFNGTTQYFREATSSDTFTPSSAASYSVWVNRSGGADALSQSLLMKYYSTTGNRVLIMTLIGSTHATLANRLLFQTYDTANVANITSYNAGGSNIWNDTWNHIACVRDGDTNKLYVNTELVNTSTAGNGSGRSSTVSYDWFSIAATAKSTSIPDLYFPGYLDQCGVWSKALTEDEIKFLYNQGSGITYSAW